MSERGAFAVDRGIWNHELFAAEKFSEREAWLWMVSAAAWRPERVRCGNSVVVLERGQFMHSERFMAQKFRWSKTKVHMFLLMLDRHNMVERNSDHYIDRITICNYEKYAFDGTERKTVERPLKDRCETKEEEPKNLNTIVQIADLNSRESEGKPRKKSEIDPHFIEFYSAYPKHQSKQDALKAYRQARKNGVSHQSIMSGLERAKIADTRFREMKFTPLPASWLRAGGYEDEPAFHGQDWKKAMFS